MLKLRFTQCNVTEQENDKLQRENGNEEFSVENFLELGLKGCVWSPDKLERTSISRQRKKLELRRETSYFMASFHPSYKWFGL